MSERATTTQDGRRGTDADRRRVDALAERYAASLMNTFGTPQLVLVRGEGC